MTDKSNQPSQNTLYRIENTITQTKDYFMVSTTNDFFPMHLFSLLGNLLKCDSSASLKTIN